MRRAISFEPKNAQVLQLLPPVTMQKQQPTINLGMALLNKNLTIINSYLLNPANGCVVFVYSTKN